MYPKETGKFVEPNVVVSHFHLHEGDEVADFGAGSGHFMKPLADAVGKSGKVYMTDIQKNLVDALGIRARELRLSNIRPLWCDLEAPQGTKLKDGLLDAGVLSNTLFQFVQKEHALTEIARVLRKGAKLFVVDWSDSFGGLGPRPASVVPEINAKMLIEKCGFVFERSFTAGDHHYGLAFRKE